MNRALSYLNLLGILALAALCVTQWRANRRVNLEAAGLEKTRLEQIARITTQDKTIQGQAADLESFREQLTRNHAALLETEAKVTAAEREILQLTAEREQLKSSVTNWAAAVAARDGQLKALGEQLQTLAQDRNETVAKFNELATNYNAVVKDLNELRAKGTASPARTNDGAK